MNGRESSSTGGVLQLDPSIVRAISTGQVIANITGACKELIENALDAGATSLDIRLTDYGLVSLEISDNGTGIAPGDFEAIALPHWTSKLTNFNELGTVHTYGFRGEALSALAAMSKLTIITRHASVNMASKLEFAADGKLKTKTPCARVVGTTTIVERFLEPLPVRRKEFERNAKNEYQKLLNMVQGYCLLLKSARMELTHKLDNGPAKVILSTHANQTMKENVCNVFGAKQLETLIDFVQIPPSQEQLVENCLPENMPMDNFVIEGLISSIEKGAGRSSGDRQFIYVNRRPCDYTKMLKVINEIYRQYNRQVYPVVFLNIDVIKGKVDANLTPDKRQVYISEESLLLLIIKTSLTGLFDKLRGVCTIGEALSTSSLTNSLTKMPSFSTASSKIIPSITSVQNSSIPSPLDKFKRSYQPSSDLVEDTPAMKQSKVESKQPKLFEPEDDVRLVNKPLFTGTDLKKEPDSMSPPFPAINRVRRSSDISDSSSYQPSTKFVQTTFHAEGSPVNKMDHSRPARPVSADPKLWESHPPTRPLSADAKLWESRTGYENDSDLYGFKSPKNVGRKEEKAFDSGQKAQGKLFPVETPWTGYRKTCQVPFSFEKLRQRYSRTENEINNAADENVGQDQFHAKITPDDKELAESELKRCLRKTDFFSIRVVGQFNQGFIVARLKDDLFIIDQHAADEKYNFETYQKSATFECQTLLSPIQLELSASQEQIIMSNLEVFRKNGFNFVINSAQSPGQRFSLSAIPHCSSCNFDKSDVDEIIAVLNDDPNIKMYRPNKLRRIFASKACRKSVMIGMALDRTKMQEILRHMGEIDQPWNCPHGRPTIRHLFNVSQIETSRSDE